MTLPMIIALAVTVLMIILIMVDKLPFGAGYQYAGYGRL